MLKRFLVLDSFRGIFALCVVFYHIHIVDSFTEAVFFKDSWILVEFFFVLSGFVMAHGYLKKNNLTFSEFLLSRTFRLFPLHIVMLIIFIVMEFGKLYAFKNGLSFTNDPFTGPGALREILPNLLLVQSWTPFTQSQSFNYTAWSISIEFYTYLIFWGTLTLLNKKVTLCWSIICLSMLFLLFIDSPLPVAPVKRGLSCFFAGGLTYLLYLKIKHITFSSVFYSVLELLVSTLLIVMISHTFPHRDLIITLLFCITILTFAYEGGVLSSFLRQKLFTRLGNLSYSIYMTQAAVVFGTVSVMMILQKVTGRQLTIDIDGRRFLTTGNLLLNNLLAVAVVFLVVFISSLTYKHIEMAGLRLGKHLLFRNRSH